MTWKGVMKVMNHAMKTAGKADVLCVQDGDCPRIMPVVVVPPNLRNVQAIKVSSQSFGAWILERYNLHTKIEPKKSKKFTDGTYL